VLVLEHLSKVYPSGVHALGGVSLAVELGEIGRRDRRIGLRKIDAAARRRPASIRLRRAPSCSMASGSRRRMRRSE